MKKFAFFLAIPAAFIVPQAFAVSPAPPPGTTANSWADCLSGPNQDVATLACIPVVLNNLIGFLAFFAGAIAVFLLMYAGLKFITSEGDPQKIAGARRTLVFVMWGAAVIVSSFVILTLISRLTGVSQIAPR